MVLNGAIFGIWGVVDVERTLDAKLDIESSELLAVLARELSGWDIGFWSRYDRYPHLVTNVASSFYHLLHIHQLEELGASHPEHPEFSHYAERFRGYRGRRRNAMRSFAHKAVFRILVPRNARLAGLVPRRTVRA
jgi:hypothetical protein